MIIRPQIASTFVLQQSGQHSLKKPKTVLWMRHQEHIRKACIYLFGYVAKNNDLRFPSLYCNFCDIHLEIFGTNRQLLSVRCTLIKIKIAQNYYFLPCTTPFAVNIVLRSS